jgi:hypothetical protein
MKVELTIAASYVPGWGTIEGVREVLQNAKDAETEFQAPMSVRVRAAKGEVGTLVIENEGCTMPYEALLLGHTSKVERGDLIGKYGEGLKIGLLALLRAGHEVKIRNGSEVWVPSIEWSNTFQAKVLVFDIQKGRKNENRVQIEVTGISPDLYQNEIKPRFLWLSKEKAGDDVVKTDYGTILLSEASKGKVFVKGILVETKPELTVGYNIDDADVDRDRRMVSSYDFAWKTRCIWRNAVAQRPDLFNAYATIIETNGPEAKDMQSYDAGRLPAEFVAHVVQAFKTQHGDKAVPVSNLGESQDLEHHGRTGVVVNASMRAVLESSMGTLVKVQEEIKTEVTKTYGWHELSVEARDNLTRAIRLTNVGAPVDLAEINVVDFRSVDLLGTHSPGSIQIARKTLDDKAGCLLVVVHEVAHRSGGDGEKGHVAQIEHIWSTIVEHLSQ